MGNNPRFVGVTIALVVRLWKQSVVNCGHSDDTLQTIDGDVISQRDYDDSYFTSDWDGEVYHIDDLRLTVDGDSVSVSELEASPDKWWKSSEDGLWHRTPAEQEELNLEQETVE
jgi:hypothetical protein